MRRLMLSGAAFFLTFCLIDVTAAPSERLLVTARWRVDLTPWGMSAPLGVEIGRTREYFTLPFTSLWFTGDGRMVATFVTRQAKPELSNRESGSHDSGLQLQAVFLDATTGKVLATPAWPTPSRYAVIVAAREGRFITETGHLLTLYSPDLSQLKALTLPPFDKTDKADWTTYSSPSGKTLLCLRSDHQRGQWFWIDAPTLEIRRSWEDLQTGYVTISDHSIAMLACAWRLHCESNYVIRSPLSDWAALAPGQGAFEPQFVSDDLLFLWSPYSIRLITDGGELLFRQHQPSDSGGWGSWGRPIISSSGQRFVLPVFQYKGAMPGFDIPGHTVLKGFDVYDVPTHRESFTLDIKGDRAKGFTQFALSPDGLRLAVLSDDTIQLFDLPAMHRP